MTRDAIGTVSGRQAGHGTGIQLGLGLLGLGVMAALVWQYLEVYFTIGGTPADATPADGTRYLVTAGLGVAVAGASLVLAVRRTRAVAFLCAAVLAAGMLGAAYVLAVPQHRWNPDPALEPLPADYHPCFTGSNDCPGG